VRQTIGRHARVIRLLHPCWSFRGTEDRRLQRDGRLRVCTRTCVPLRGTAERARCVCVDGGLIVSDLGEKERER